MSRIEKTREELLQEVAELRAKTLTLRREVVDKMSQLATAAFGLVAALAWNSAIQAVFARAFAVPGTAIWALLAYAALVTVIAVIVILIIGRIAGKLKAEEKKADEAASNPTP